MIILTGGAGFIGSNLLSALNAKGITDVLVVDRRGDNFRNLSDLKFSDFMQPDEFARAIERKSLPDRIEAIFHQGACADTTCTDGRYMIENNFTFSKLILHFALSRKVPFVYASSAAVYGSSSAFAPSRENERPLNLYATVQTRVRQSCPQRRREISRAPSPVFDTSTSTVRANLTRAKWRRWCINSIGN